MAVSNLILKIAEIPKEGLKLQGEIDREVFDLRDDLARPRSSLGYDLQATVADGQLRLDGTVEATFELTCVRSLVPFSHTVRLDPYREAIDLEDSGSLDLTDQLREGILLALPAYPRAPGTDADSESPQAVAQRGAAGSQGRRSEWDALDGLKTKD